MILSGVQMKTVFVFLIALLTMGGQMQAQFTVSDADPFFQVTPTLPGKLNYYLNCYAESLKERHLTLVSRNSEGCDNCITKISLTFDLFDTPNFDGAREVIVDLVGDLLKGVNARPDELKRYFAVFPLTIQNVDVRVRIRQNTQGCFIYPVLGNIAIISAADGIIVYDTMNSFTFQLDMLRRETFENALKWVTFANPSKYPSL